MSSSKKKQARKEQGKTGRQSSATQQTKDLKRYTVTFWIVIALVMVLFVGALANQFIVDPIANAVNNVVYPKTDAIQVGDHTLTSVDLNYFYVSTFNTYYSNVYSTYYMYIYYNIYTLEQCLGFSLSKSLAKQELTDDTKAALETEADNWADYFMESTSETIKTVYALYDLAVENGHKLTDDEQKDLDKSLASLDEDADDAGYRSAKSYLRAIYGNGANVDSYTNYMNVRALANSYYTKWYDDQEFDADDLKEFVGDELYKYNSYTFATYQIKVSDFYVSPTTSSSATAAEKAAAVAAAKEAAEKLASGEYKDLEEFLAAAKKTDKEITSTDSTTKATDATVTEDKDPTNYTKYSKKLYSSISTLFQKWLIGDESADDADEDTKIEYVTRNPGDATVISYPTETESDSDITSFYVVCFGEVSDNSVLLKDVRHLLVSFGNDDDEDPTDEQKAAAKEKAEGYLADWAEHDYELDYFIELLTKNSDDKTNGTVNNEGLYEDIQPDSNYVENFLNWCFEDGRKKGDYGIVETEYGYHIMYLEDESELTYRDTMIEDDLREETAQKWQEELAAGISYTEITLDHLKVKFN